jgi:hypothetical protein
LQCEISKSKYNGNPAQFEVEYCPKQRALKGKLEGVEKLASYKQSINGQFKQSTSATYAQASPLYYEYSRYFNLTVDIPVAVIRTMDAQEHFRRVGSKGHAIAQGKMIANGWKVVTSAEKNPTAYIPVNEFYYEDPKDDILYGTMLKNTGARSGAEFNGDFGPHTRASVGAFQAWGGVAVDGIVGDQTWSVSLQVACRFSAQIDRANPHQRRGERARHRCRCGQWYGAHLMGPRGNSRAR